MATSPEAVEARSGNSRNLLLVVGLLLVLLIAVWFFLLRGGPAETVAVPPAPTTTTPPLPDATEPPAKPNKGPLETFEVFAPKDPFKPLIAVGGSGVAAAPATGTTSTGGDTGSTGGTGNSAPSGGSDISGGTSSGDSVGGHRVRLIDTFRSGGRSRARVQVDGTVYTVDEGDRFADNFQLVSISGSCASMLFGDDQFSLCEGEEILK